MSKIVFPLAIVLTQDCDLAQDYSSRRKMVPNQDKHIISALLAPLYNAEHVYTGEHLKDVGIDMAAINKTKTPGQYLRNNDRPRYHYLEFEPNVPIVPSVVDFKHYFTVPIETLRSLKRKRFVCTLSTLYREDVSQRFATFLARVGLPDPVSLKTAPEAAGAS